MRPCRIAEWGSGPTTICRISISDAEEHAAENGEGFEPVVVEI
jgi:hypothetical protein